MSSGHSSLSTTLRQELAAYLTALTTVLKRLQPDERAILDQNYQDARAKLQALPEAPEQARRRLALDNYLGSRFQINKLPKPDTFQADLKEFVANKQAYLSSLPSDTVTRSLFSDPLPIVEKYRKAKKIEQELESKKLWLNIKDFLRHSEYCQAKESFDELFPEEGVSQSSKFKTSFSRLATLLEQRQYPIRNRHIKDLLIEILIVNSQKKYAGSEADLIRVMNSVDELIRTRKADIAKKYESLADELLIEKIYWSRLIFGLGIGILTLAILVLFPYILLELASLIGISSGIFVAVMDSIAMLTTMIVGSLTTAYLLETSKSLAKPKISKMMFGIEEELLNGEDEMVELDSRPR